MTFAAPTTAPTTITAAIVAAATFPYVAITATGEVIPTWTYPEAKEVAGSTGWAGRPTVLLDEEGQVNWDGVLWRLPNLAGLAR